MNPQSSRPQSETTKVNWACLTVAVVLMLVGSVHPTLLANAHGQADHGLAMAWFWAMSAGLTRGVGFIPKQRLIKYLLSGYAVMVALALAFWLRVMG